MFFGNRFYVIKVIPHTNYNICLLETLSEQYTKTYRKLSLYQPSMENTLIAALVRGISPCFLLKLRSSRSAINCCSALMYNISTGGDRIFNIRYFLLTSSRLCLLLLMCIWNKSSNALKKRKRNISEKNLNSSRSIYFQNEKWLLSLFFRSLQIHPNLPLLLHPLPICL